MSGEGDFPLSKGARGPLLGDLVMAQFPAARLGADGRIEFETPEKLRIVHADVDSLIVVADFVMRDEMRRDLQRAQALAAQLDGTLTEGHKQDPETKAELDVGADAWEELRPLGDAHGIDPDAPFMLELGGQLFEIASYRWSGYQWYLRSEKIELWLNPRKQRTRPAAKVRLAPMFMAEVGARDAWAAAKSILMNLALETEAGMAFDARVQRVDVKVDFLGASWLCSRTTLARMSTRAIKGDWFKLPYGDRNLPKTQKDEDEQAAEEVEEVHSYSHRQRETGWTLGKKDRVQVGCYDKTFEIGQKEGVVPVWQRALWREALGEDLPAGALDPKAPTSEHVIRLEARFATEALRSFRVRAVKGAPRRDLRAPEDVLDAVPDLWRYATEGWLRVINPTLTRRRICPTNAVWEAISSWPRGVDTPAGQATFGSAPKVDVTRVQAGVSKAAQAAAQFMGGLSSIFAVVGPSEVLSAFRRRMPETSALDAAVLVSANFLRRFAKKKALPEVAERLYGNALEKELRLSSTLGHPTQHLQRIFLDAKQAVTDLDADDVLVAMVGRARKERERRKTAALNAVFEGCDMTDPKIQQAYQRSARKFEEADEEIRELFDEVVREMFELDGGADVRGFLLGEAGAA